MADTSLLATVKALEQQVGAILSAYDVADLPQRERELTIAFRNQLIDARLEVQTYEYAQTRVEQLEAAKAAKKYIAQVQASIIKASEYNLFGAVDVAQMSAGIEHIISRLA